MQLAEWNPSVGTSCNLWLGYYVCVAAPDTGSRVSSTTTSSPTTTSATATAPSPLEPSTDTQCTAWHYVVSGDTCYAIEQTYGITAAQVRSLEGNVLDSSTLVPRLIPRTAGRLEPDCRDELQSVAGLLRLCRSAELRGSYLFPGSAWSSKEGLVTGRISPLSTVSVSCRSPICPNHAQTPLED